MTWSFKKKYENISVFRIDKFSISIMRKNGKKFYIKNDLAEWADQATSLTINERDMDFLSLANNFF